MTKEQLQRLGNLSYSLGFMVFGLVSARYANMAQTAISVGTNGYNVYQGVQKKDLKKALEALAQCIGSGLFLSVQVYGGIELTVLSMLMRALLTFYSALSDIIKNNGTIRLEAIANLVLAGIYLKQMQPHVEELQRKYRVLRSPEFSFLLEHIRAAGKQRQAGPLTNLQTLIKKKLGVIKDKALGMIDLGEHIGNMGGRLVKGGNISLRERNIDGKAITEVEFKLNKTERDAIQPLIDKLQALPSDKLADFLHYAGVNGGGVQVNCLAYDYLAKQGDGYTQNNKMEVGHAYEIRFQGVGSILIGADPNCLSLYDRVVVRLNGQKETQDMRNLLSLIGLEKALEPSSADDIERLKIAALFEAYHPKEATDLKNKTEFFNLSITNLKARIIQLAPDMKEKFNSILSKVKPVETLPGRIQYAVPDLAKKAKELGAVALVSGVSGNGSLSSAFNRVVSMLKVGALPSQVRFESGLIVSGASSQADHYYGSANEVFTRMITEGACNRAIPISYLPFAGDVLMVYSPKVLDQVTYQYHYDSYGSKEEYTYKHRPDLFSFTKEENKNFHEGNEVMVSDTIRPEMMVGCVVSSETAKNQLIQTLETSLKQPEVMKNNTALSTDAAGRLMINKIPLNQFVQVGKTLNTKLFANATK
jgi:hypothetical protein